MKTGIDTLSFKQWRRVVTAFESRMRKLKESGDYPEEYEDKITHQRLVDHLYDLQKVKGGN